MRLRREKGTQSREPDAPSSPWSSPALTDRSASNGPEQDEEAISPRAMSRYGSHPSAKAEDDDEEPETRAEATAAVGGDDVDSDRSAKYARVSVDPDGDAESRVSEDDEDGDDDDAAMPNASDAELENEADPNLEADGEQGTEEIDLAPESPSETIGQAMERADELMSSQLATPERDPSPATQQSVEASGGSRSTRLPVKTRGKRPKGWHLRRENRHLREAVMKGSPIRSERQESVDTLENNHPEPGGILKRLPGRRRAPHHDPSIEADMRRQLELKIAYRAVAKALKPLLAELAQRTTDGLESDPNVHERCSEYDLINAQLDERLKIRLEVLEKQFEYEQARLTRVHDAHKDIAMRRFEAKLDDYFENNLLSCEHRLLKLLRHAEMERDAEATEDEAEVALTLQKPAERRDRGFLPDALETDVGVIPDLFITNKITGQRELLHRQSDSRSRFYAQTERYADELQSRVDARLAQKHYDDSSLLVAPKDFAVFDGTRRAHARSEVMLITLLDASHRVEADAAREAQRLAKESEARLQILASASEIANTSIPAPVVKPEAPVVTNGSVAPTTTVSAQGRTPAREKNRNNALSISNLVSSDPAPKRADPEYQHDASQYSRHAASPNINSRPAWPQPQRGYEAPPVAQHSPRPPLLMQAYPGPRDEEHNRAMEDTDSSRQRPRRSTSEYPPHPLGKDYLERRSEYPSLGQLTQPGPPQDRLNQYPAYPYPRAYAQEPAPNYGYAPQQQQQPPPPPPAHERLDARLMPRYGNEPPYASPYIEQRHPSDRTVFGPTSYADVNDRDRRQYEARRGEYRSSSQSRPPVPGNHEQQSPYGQFPVSDRRILQPTTFAASPDYRSERTGGQVQRPLSPRMAYDPARPEGRASVRHTPAPYDTPSQAPPPPLEFRAWNHSHSRPGEGAEQWQQYPPSVAPNEPKQLAGRPPLFASSTQEPRSMARSGHQEPLPPNRGKPSPRQGGRAKREHSQERMRDIGRGERAEAPGFLFRPYQPPGEQAPPAETRLAQGQMPAPSQPSGSSLHGATAPGYHHRGHDTGPSLPASDMQRHLGQRIGQQLLPATLDPGRAPQSQPQSSHSSPRAGGLHHRQRSSTASAHLPPENEARARAYPGQIESAGNPSGTPSTRDGSGRSLQQAPGASQPWQQPPPWPGFEAQYAPPQPSLHGPGVQPGAQGSTGSGQMPRQAQPVITWWQSEAPARTTFIHAAQNGQQPSNKNLDGRYWRTRRRRPSSPR